MAKRKGGPSKTRMSRVKGRTSAEQFITAQRLIQEAGHSDAIELNLRNLTKLIELPAEIVGLASLQSLDLTGTQISDLAPIADLTALQSLDLTGTQISDLAPIAGLTALASLRINRTQVGDLAPLANLTVLKYLDLDSTRVNNLGPVDNLTNLETVWLNGTIWPHWSLSLPLGPSDLGKHWLGISLQLPRSPA
jgi:Leucine-rich repeat (LRR) protein